MNAVFIVAGLAVIGIIAALSTSWRRGDRSADMGAVSHQWIAEHRFGPGEDVRR